MLCAVSAVAFADFSSIARTTYTAEITFTSTGTVALEARIYNLNGTEPAQQKITWDESDITLGQTEWMRARQYVKLSSTITVIGGGIQVYTDNCAADANPRFYVVNPTSFNPVGLIKNSTRDKGLKMCWRLTDNTTDTLTINSVMQGTAVKLYNPDLGSTYPCFLWMKDRSCPDLPTTPENDAFANGEDYVTMLEEYRGAQHAEGTWAPMASPNYLYLGANFVDAAAPETYRTSALRIEAFVE